MEQSCGSSDVTDEDIMVAAILLELPSLISQSHSLHRTWGSKGKRSTSQSKLVAALKQSPPPPQHQSSPPPSKLAGSTYETLTSSPATPLSFPPSDSDEKPFPPLKPKPHLNNLRKKQEQWLEIIDDFSRCNEF